MTPVSVLGGEYELVSRWMYCTGVVELSLADVVTLHHLQGEGEGECDADVVPAGLCRVHTRGHRDQHGHLALGRQDQTHLRLQRRGEWNIERCLGDWSAAL